jgi:hypothetical protein
VKSRLLVPVLTAVLVITAMAFQSMTPEVTVMAAPDVSLAEITGFVSEKLEISEAERTVLPSDTRMEKRRYVAANGEWHQVSLVVGGKSKSSIHRPELCLPAQGFRMESPRTRRIGSADWRLMTLSAKDAPSVGFAYTFFNQDGYHTARHVMRIVRDVWDRSVLNRIDRWVMVTVSSSRADDAGLAAFLSKLKGVVE